LARLACFLRSVDYSLQELMRHLVFSAAQQVLDHLVTSYHAPEEEEVDDNQTRVKHLHFSFYCNIFFSSQHFNILCVPALLAGIAIQVYK
jgi:hypothetical protein